jgi:hypothetical protein
MLNNHDFSSKMEVVETRRECSVEISGAKNISDAIMGLILSPIVHRISVAHIVDHLF